MKVISSNKIDWIYEKKKPFKKVKVKPNIPYCHLEFQVINGSNHWKPFLTNSSWKWLRVWCFIWSNSPSPTNPDPDRYELHSIQIKDVTAVKIQQPRRAREKNFQQYFQSKQWPLVLLVQVCSGNGFKIIMKWQFNAFQQPILNSSNHSFWSILNLWILIIVDGFSCKVKWSTT